MKKLAVPKFASDKAEAEWWDAHKDAVESNLIEAMKKGTAQRVTPGFLAERIRKTRESKNITIRMPLADIERARVLSDKKGIGYQTYMKMLLHEALDREQAAAKEPRHRKVS